MKLIIAGTRTLTPSFDFIFSSIKMLGITNITEIVSGGAPGVDLEGEHFASHMHLPVKRFLPDWDKHGKSAGPKRNRQMAEYADALLLIWDGQSKGSSSMKQEAIKLRRSVYEIVIREYDEVIDT